MEFTIFEKCVFVVGVRGCMTYSDWCSWINGTFSLPLNWGFFTYCPPQPPIPTQHQGFQVGLHWESKNTVSFRVRQIWDQTATLPLPVWSWIRYHTFLCLSFLIFKCRSHLNLTRILEQLKCCSFLVLDMVPGTGKVALKCLCFCFLPTLSYLQEDPKPDMYKIILINEFFLPLGINVHSSY